MCGVGFCFRPCLLVIRAFGLEGFPFLFQFQDAGAGGFLQGGQFGGQQGFVFTGLLPEGVRVGTITGDGALNAGDFRFGLVQLFAELLELPVKLLFPRNGTVGQALVFQFDTFRFAYGALAAFSGGGRLVTCFFEGGLEGFQLLL